MIAATYDVCYCDENCLNSVYWFKAGTLDVEPVVTRFTTDYLTGSFGENPAIVNTGRLLVFLGLGTTGSPVMGSRGLGAVGAVGCGWTGGTETKTREMKLLRDDDGNVDKESCLNTPQPLGISGHRLARGPRLTVSGNTDYTEPETILEVLDPGRPRGQLYGKVPPNCAANIRISVLVWSDMGTEIAFDRSHGLKDGDRVRLSGVNPDPAENTDAARKLAVKRAEMFNTVHEVFVSCDDDATSCWKILVPVRFAAAEFPPIPNVPSVDWSRTSLETFRGIKVDDGAESPEGRGYIVCWCSECSTAATDFQSYVGQAGQITVKRPNAMPEAYLGLTTVMPDLSPGYTNPGGPVAIAFVTGDVAHYATATGQQHLVFEILPGLDESVPGSPVYRDVLLPRTNLLEPLSVSADLDQPQEARQDFCGEVFVELWSEDPEGFPMPDGCYYSEDSTNPDMLVKQLHILFGERNHLKKNTRYMAITNMDVLAELQADFPATGAVWIWSMDDAFNNPFGVVEKGSAYPSPTNRVPPRDTLGNPMFNTNGDPRFDSEGALPEGFKILGTNGALIEEMQTFCIPHDEKNPSVSPSTTLACQPCQSEEDCGNGGNGVYPDPSLSYCRSPIDLKCPQANGDLLNAAIHPATLAAPPDAVGHWRLLSGIVVGVAPWPINTLRIIMPNIMADINDQISMVMKIGNLPLPAGGFFPSIVTAEPVAQGARLYKMPLILSASLVSKVGDGNQAPFRGDTTNRIYARIAFGTTFHGFGNLAAINFKLPIGYSCATTQQGGSVPDLDILANKFPSTKGRLGGRLTEVRYRNIPATPDVMCQITLLQNMIVYARTIYFVELVVNNPTTALKRDDPNNAWSLGVVNNGFNPAQTIASTPLSTKELTFCPSPRDTLFCLQELGTDYSNALSVLGKLSDFFIAPAQYGVGQLNTLSVFFMTEQEVGSLTNVETEIWVDAPSGFNFGQYCSALPLDDIYYIPEGRGTSPLPAGELIPCVGAPTSVNELTYNRAKLSTTGRLLRGTFYGFRVQVVNAAVYVRTQLDEWRLWTYVKTTGNGVDGTYETARVNERVPAGADTSWGMYLQGMPTKPGGPTTCSLPGRVDRRHFGRHGIVGIGIAWGRFQMQSWPGVIYGFACKIRIPMVPPTGSANQFTIEFGYNEDLLANRLEAGTTEAPVVQRLINGAITYTTSIMNMAVDITFSVRTITNIPEGGGLVVIGPPNFLFQTRCQPKPATNFPELPYDSTCLYAAITSTGEPKIELIAGPTGIPALYYQFSLAAQNPPQAVALVDAGMWTLLSYSLISEQIVLDQNTTVPGYAVAREMVSAGLVMWPRVDCDFITLEEKRWDPGQTS
ncbi:unnamed protein product, partial [Effrenium voratum]